MSSTNFMNPAVLTFKGLWNIMACDLCWDFCNEGMEDLESSIVMLGNTNNRTLGEHVKDLQNWLTAVYSFQSQCKHAINNTDEKFKSPILEFMLNSTKFTGKALAIASSRISLRILALTELPLVSMISTSNIHEGFEMLPIIPRGFPQQIVNSCPQRNNKNLM